MTTAFERRLVSDTQLHNEWQTEIDRRDDIIYSDKQVIADLHNETARLDERLAHCEAENERLVNLVSALPPAVIEPEIEALLLRLETPTREDVANGTTVVYTPRTDVLWVCAAYRRLRAITALTAPDAGYVMVPTTPEQNP